MAVSAAGGATVGPMLPGTLVVYTEFTSNVTISGTTEGTANTIVTSAAFVADGTSQYWVEFWCPGVNTGASDSVVIIVTDSVGPTVLGRIDIADPAAGVYIVPAQFKRKVTPSAGVHTYTAAGFRVTNNGLVIAGAGGSGNRVPGFISITKAVN